MRLPHTALNTGRKQRHLRILDRLEDYIIDAIERSLNNPTEVEIVGPLIACANGVKRHVDSADVFDPWSAFYVVHNDDCVVWGNKGALHICPREGERFELNINRQHGVQVPRRKGHQVFVAMLADGTTRREAQMKLSAMLRNYGFA